jgi:DNA-binding NarL/FixJ family response regulator
MENIRVLVVDDHIIVRDDICALLALAEDIEVVGVRHPTLPKR